MRKRKCHVSLIVLILCCMASFFATITVNAASKDVTKKYKKKAQTVIDPFAGYLGYGCNKSSTFVFDDYARSTMLCFNDWYDFSGKTLAQLKRVYKKEWKKAFTASFNFKMKKNKGRDKNGYTLPTNQWSNVSYLIQIDKKTGQAHYYGGDWGEAGPRGYLKKVIQKNKNTFIVTYKIFWWNDWSEEKGDLMGSYRIILKKSGSNFKIDDIKQIKALVNL